MSRRVALDSTNPRNNPGIPQITSHPAILSGAFTPTIFQTPTFTNRLPKIAENICIRLSPSSTGDASPSSLEGCSGTPTANGRISNSLLLKSKMAEGLDLVLSNVVDCDVSPSFSASASVKRTLASELRRQRWKRLVCRRVASVQNWENESLQVISARRQR